MHHQSLDQISQVASISSVEKTPSRATRCERLHRLATILEEYDAPVRLLSRIEYCSQSERRALRCDRSPLALAFEDDEFRRQGLKSDRLGDFVTFFGLSDDEAHRLFCDCHFGMSMETNARGVAWRVRAFADERSFGESIRAAWSGIRSRFLPA
jgi:hypothetical protein